MHIRSVGTLLVLACLLVDFANPSLPGVFSLEEPQLFMDGALAKAAPARPAPTQQPQPLQPLDERVATSSSRAAQRSIGTRRRVRRHPERRYLSRSSGRASAPADAH
jgi:hypothetical protein